MGTPISERDAAVMLRSLHDVALKIYARGSRLGLNEDDLRRLRSAFEPIERSHFDKAHLAEICRLAQMSREEYVTLFNAYDQHCWRTDPQYLFSQIESWLHQRAHKE